MLLGLVLGASLGTAAHFAAPGAAWLDAIVEYVTGPIGTIFLRLLSMLVIPLVVPALALGVAGLGDLRHLGRVGVRFGLYTVAVSSIAVVLGIALVEIVGPGRGLDPALAERLRAGVAGGAPATANPLASRSGADFFVQLVPSNPVAALAQSDMLAVMVFSLLLGVGLAAVRTEPARRLEESLQGLFDVVMWLLGMVIRMAPVGVACLVFTTTARLGYEVLQQLAAYVGVVVGALAFHMFVTYSASVYWLGGMRPLVFFRGVRAAILTAFSTASSNATLPTALLVAERELRLPAHVSRFVLTIGSTANQNGTALFEGVTVLFLAQLYGVDLALGQQLAVVGVCILGGIGTAGVPAGSIPVVAMILGMVGVPAEAIGLILGVDRFLDMCRTTVNVTGDLAAAVVVSRGEKIAG
ncbi:MAG: dicarboxylate/amino acid:cation symporter [Proteobacteria bacterium]|nr:MAG: dicarboxylate/amino acid:cation symporter [Pseudomonadota bacterium]